MYVLIIVDVDVDVCTDNFCAFLQSLQSDVVARELQRITADNNLLRRQIIASLEAADVTERKHTAAVRTLKVGISQSNMLTIAAGERTAAVELLCEGLKGRLAEVAHLQELYQKGIRAIIKPPIFINMPEVVRYIQTWPSECIKCYLCKRRGPPRNAVTTICRV